MATSMLEPARRGSSSGETNVQETGEDTGGAKKRKRAIAEDGDLFAPQRKKLRVDTSDSVPKLTPALELTTNAQVTPELTGSQAHE